MPVKADAEVIWQSDAEIAAVPDLPKLHRALRAPCRRCEVAGWLRQADPVAFFGEQRSIMLVGQAPGPRSAEHGVPFGNPASNRRLTSWFGEAGWTEPERWRDTMYITAVTKCFPGKATETARGGAGDRVPSPAEQALCRPWLEAQVRLVEPQIVLLVGGLAIRTWLRPLGLRAADLSLGAVVGRGFTDGAGRRLLPLPHPSGVSRWLNAPANLAHIAAALALLRRWCAAL